jgi:glycosyltransferase involved in cell wall biosynthesis
MKKVLHRIFFNFDNTRDPFLPYLETWKTELPDFEIMQWDKSNLPLDLNPYTKYMAETKNHAFLSDYFRCWLLKNFGGAYLDADIEILNGDVFRKIYEEAQNADDYNLFIGVESKKNGLLTLHSMGCKEGQPHEALFFLMNLYETVFTTSMRYFIKEFPITDLLCLYFINYETQENYRDSNNGRFIERTRPFITKNIKIYPQDYFSPVTTYNNDMMISAFSENTCLCHHFAATWKKTNNPNRQLFGEILRSGNYVLSPDLIPALQTRYKLPHRPKTPAWALSSREIIKLERFLNRIIPYGGTLYNIARDLLKAGK